MPTKKIGGRCKAGYIQTGRVCRQNPKYVKGHKSHAAQVARGVVSTTRKDGKPDRHFKSNRMRLPKKSGASVSY